MSGLESWIQTQYLQAAQGLLKSISPIGLTKIRPHFHQTVTPKKGAVVASPVLAAYDPDPDYFFHWYRDSAVVMDALRLLYLDGTIGNEAVDHVSDFVTFSLSLNGLDGRLYAPLRALPEFEKFLRKDLPRIHGDAVAADTRVNPDGTLDISDWARPQHDGPALRALTLMRWVDHVPAGVVGPLFALLRGDLAFVLHHARRPCFDIWEEELGLHYFTLRVSAAALTEGAAWLAACGATQEAERCRAEADSVMQQLDGFWRADGYVGSRGLGTTPTSSKDLDIAVILAVIHSGDGASHGPRDPRLQATLSKLDALFDAAYAINHDRPAGQAPALGRYAGDVYYSGGAYYFATLGAAEFCFRAGDPARGDAYLGTVRRFTPITGEMSEQFDQSTGAQTSAKQLAWSYAAFISCVAARNAAVWPR